MKLQQSMLLQHWQAKDILQIDQKLSNNKIFRLQVIFSQFWFCYSMAGEAWLREGYVCQCVLALGLFW